MSYSSKFRHIYGQKAKKNGHYADIKNPMTSGESQYVKANDKFMAYGRTGGGASIFIRKLTDVGRTKASTPYISTHSGRLTDFDFHPFVSNIIATAADDCAINITKFPKDGLTEKITKSDINIKGHKKKISLVKFNPSSNNIIASGSYDRTVKIFNIETGAPLSSFDDYKDNIYSLSWNSNGSLLGTTSKDKILRIFDPRQTDDAIRIEDSFGSVKAMKCFFLNNKSFNWIGSTGFSKSAKRQLKLWDYRNISKPLKVQDIDQASSVLVPHFDNDLSVLYLVGKGDNSITYYEVRNDDRMVHYLSLYRDSTPQKGGGWVLKRGLNVMQCEVQRFLKLTRDTIMPISFIVPRKSGGDVFQDDIFPQCSSPRAAQTADEWSSGTNKTPVTMSMDPDERDDDNSGNDEIVFSKKKTYSEICIENNELKNKVKSLETEIEELKKQLNDKNKDNNDEENNNDDENKEEDQNE